MNGFAVFDSPATAERFLEHRAATNVCAAGTFRRASYEPRVVTFRNVPEEDVKRLEELIAELGGELQSSRRYQPLG